MTTLTLVMLSFAASGLAGEVAYLQARVAEEAGRHGQAIASFEAVARQDPLLHPYAKLGIARCQSAQGQTAAAAATYLAVIDTFPAGPWRRIAALELGMMHRRANRHAEAAPLMLTAMDLERVPWWMESQAWSGADSAVSSGYHPERGFAHFAEVTLSTIWRQPRLDSARKLAASPHLPDRRIGVDGLLRSNAVTEAGRALTASAPLLAAGGLWDSLEIAGRLLDAGSREAARTVDLRGLEEEELAWLRVWLLYQVHRLIGEGKRAEAAAACDLLVERFPNTRETGFALYTLGEHLESNERATEAIQVFETMARTCPDHPRAPNALMKAAGLHESLGDTEGAYRTWLRLAEQHPDSRFASEAHFACAAHEHGRNRPVARRWHLAKAAASGVGDFHAHRAFDILYEEAPAVRASVPNLRVDGGAFSMVRPFPFEDTRMAAAPPEFFADPRMQRLSFFARHGWDEAEWEALELCRALQHDPRAGTLYRAIAETGASYTVMQQARVYEVGMRGPRRGIEALRLEFPRAYWPKVKRISEETGVDPYLVLAIAKQESTFRPRIRSHAGATGVMQLMPATARWLAQVDSYIDRSDADNLTNPESSIRMGARYLRRMLDRSDGNIVFALASYNAGPGNCDRWRARFPNHTLEEFVEAIPFRETRHYVKRVLANYAAYHSLYPAERAATY